MESHVARGRQAQTEQVGTILLWGTASVVVLIILLAWLRGYFFVMRNETIEKVYLSAANLKLEELRVQEDSLLTSYGWVNREHGIVHIPIDRAMELVVRETQSAPAPGTPTGGTR